MLLTLASGSPRRRELLAQLGVAFDCAVADIDETPLSSEDPAAYVQRLAVAKALAVAARADGERAVLGADTTVVVDEDILGKPADRLDGMAMLARLSGREHRVLTGVSLVSSTAGALGAVVVETRVEFVTLDRATCEAYLSTEEPWDKAGAYGIQGLGGALVSAIHGSYSNVVGLPLAETRTLLAAHGIPTSLDPGGAGS